MKLGSSRRVYRHRVVAALLSALLSSAALAALTAGALGTYFARRILTPAKRPDERVQVREIEKTAIGETTQGTRVWLTGPDADLTGSYSFIFDNLTGHARLGPVCGRVDTGTEVRVARTLHSIDRGQLNVGSAGRVTGWWYTSPEEVGPHSTRVQISAPRGKIGAWLVHPETGPSSHWVIHVHGRGALPEETLRGVPAGIRAGTSNLVISYRNDPTAPAGIRRRYGLGLAERYDVDAAVRWALENGAQQITLVGWSMGGTTVLLAATRGPYRGWINGLVLDTPGVDWIQILRTQAKLAGVPQVIADISRFALQYRLTGGAHPEQPGTDIRSLTPERFARDLAVPTLIHTGPEDTFVPWDGARTLAQLRPDLVQLREAPGEHVKVWNVDPQAWETATEEFIRQLRSPVAHLESA